MFQAHLPDVFWGDAIFTATYLINRIPAYILGCKIPYELIYEKKLDIEHLKIFGCLCYATNNAPHKMKFDHRSFTCIFIGYPVDLKGYKLLNLKTNEVMVSRDVKFLETVCPFDPLFPKQHLIPISDYRDSIVPNNDSIGRQKFSEVIDKDVEIIGTRKRRLPVWLKEPHTYR
ncbi:hypothetical protein LIER_33557 [Lithospermum erythrorhizon]|uniref:Retroviral polymerase SH3-like domain-containing protein n=1 Tax=Lithospermum erythrorhizon TaxID=34254 RepID=A0AAV3RZA5_LITER